MDPVVKGWLLGLIGGMISAIAVSLILDWIRAWASRKLIAKGIRTDLDELRLRLVAKATGARMSTNCIKREDLLWAREALADCHGDSPDGTLLSDVNGLLKMREDQLAEWCEQKKAAKLLEERSGSPPRTTRFVTGELPFLEANLHQLGSFGPLAQRGLLAVRSQLFMLNSHIAILDRHLDMTLACSDVKEALVVNIRETSDAIIERCCALSDLIGKVSLD